MMQDRHPDMYISEVDGQGVPVLENGKPKLKIDPETNAPMLNAESEKGKMFIKVYSEDVRGFDNSKFGPRLAMNEMERRMTEAANAAINNPPEGAPAPEGQPNNQPNQANAASPQGQGAMMPGGVTPPVQGKVSFASDDEKSHAEKAVARGVYETLEEYCRLRDGGDQGYTEEGSTPQFQNK